MRPIMRMDRSQVTEGPVGRTLLQLAAPMVVGILTMMTFNVVDTFFIGQLGAKPLAAIGFTFPVVFVITGATMGMGIGMASVVSRAVGGGDHEQVAITTTHGLMFVIPLVFAFAGCGILLHDSIFRLLGAEPELIPLIRSYMLVWFAGVPLIVMPMIGNSALRATGDSLTPSLIMMVAAIMNLILDPLLIFGLGPFPRLELQGAAWATVIAYAMTFSASAWVLHHRERLLVFHRPVWTDVFATWRRLLHIGLPATCTNMLIPLANGSLTRIMSGFGPHAVAAFGVCSRIESLVMVGAFAMTTIMVPYAGQNFGAGKPQRVVAGLRFGLRYCFLISAIIWVILAGGGYWIAGWFSDDAEIIAIIRPFLFWVPISYGAFGYNLLVTATFNGSGRPGKAMLIFGSRLFGLIVPLTWILTRWMGVPGMFVAMIGGNFGAGLFAEWMNQRRNREFE